MAKHIMATARVKMLSPRWWWTNKNSRGAHRGKNNTTALHTHPHLKTHLEMSEFLCPVCVVGGPVIVCAVAAASTKIVSNFLCLCKSFCALSLSSFLAPTHTLQQLWRFDRREIAYFVPIKSVSLIF